MELKKVLGINIRYYRLKQKYTQEQLAEKLNVSSKYVGRIEHGKHSPQLDTLEQLAKILEIEPYVLFQYEPSHNTIPSRK